MSRPVHLEPDLDAVASDWIARRDHGLSASDESALSAWLREPAHAEAFARCEAMWGALPKLRKLPAGELDALMAPRPAQPIRRSLGEGGSSSNGRKRLAPVLWLTGATAAAAAVALLFFVSDHNVVPRDIPVVQTHTAPADAESRIALPDGSIAVLHRGSRIAFGDFTSARRVRLLSGEAHFTVAKTTSSPFFVHAGQVAIRDIGTAFNVRLDPDRVAVFVTDGSVAVRNLAIESRNISEGNGSPDSATAESRLTMVNQAVAAPSGEWVLTVGQQVVVETARIAPADVRAPAPAEVEQALAWKSRRISFDRTSLADAVSELNRYNVRQLRIADPEISAVLLAGGVQSDNLDAFVRLLDSGFGVTAENRGDEIILRKAR